MTYWIKRIMLKSGELVTEKELRPEENLFEGRTPVVGDKLLVNCRGRSFEAKVMWGNWSTSPLRDSEAVIPLRVQEI
jgi:hypothetical protein